MGHLQVLQKGQGRHFQNIFGCSLGDWNGCLDSVLVGPISQLHHCFFSPGATVKEERILEFRHEVSLGIVRWRKVLPRTGCFCFGHGRGGKCSRCFCFSSPLLDCETPTEYSYNPMLSWMIACGFGAKQGDDDKASHLCFLQSAADSNTMRLVGNDVLRTQLVASS